MKQKKIRKFNSLLPTINKLIIEGYTHQSIVVVLKTEHDLDLTVPTFRNYYYSRSNKLDIEVKSEPSEVNQSNSPANCSNIDSVQSSFLSQFNEDKTSIESENINKGSIDSLAERQNLKGDVFNNSRNKAKDLLNNAAMKIAKASK